jgi:hypothetical protein
MVGRPKAESCAFASFSDTPYPRARPAATAGLFGARRANAAAADAASVSRRVALYACTCVWMGRVSTVRVR